MKHTLPKTFLIYCLAFLTYSCDRPSKLIKSRHENGNPEKIVFYNNPEDKLHYQSIVLYDNGDTAQVNESYNGYRHGKSISFYQSGNIREISYYHKGGRIDTTKKYFDTKSSLLQELVIYRDSSLFGESTLFFNDQSIRGTLMYYNIQKHGEFKLLYPSGLSHIAGYFNYDQLDGEYLEFYDGFHDTVIYVPKTGDPYVTTKSTHPKSYKFYDRDRLLFEIEYDTSKTITNANGCLLCVQREDTLVGKVGEKLKQVWNTPVIENSDQYYVILNKSLNIQDTITTVVDSTYTKWVTAIKKPGEYDFQAIAFLRKESLSMNDTTRFKIIVTK